MKGQRGNGSVFQRGTVWWVKYHRHGRPYRESSGSTKEADARKLLKRRLGEIALDRFVGPESERLTIRDLAKDYVNDYRINKRKSLDKAERMVWRVDSDGTKRDSELMKTFGDCKAHQVRTDHIKSYISHRLEQGAANATVNRELAALKRMYSLAMHAEKIHRKPYIPMLQENNVRRGFFERPEFLRFRAALPDHLKPVVTFAYFSGWRRGEILGLKWNQVDLAAQTIRIEGDATKNKKARTVILDGEWLESVKGQWVKRIVAEIPGQSPTLLCPYVFHLKGKPISDPRKAFANALKAAGLTGKLLHDFRRTAVRNLTRARVPETVAMKITGHKTRSVFDRYDITSEEDLRQATAKVLELAQAQDEKEKVVPLQASR